MKLMCFFLKTAILAAVIATCQIGRADNFVYGISTPGAISAFTVTNMQSDTVFPGSNPNLILTAGATYRLFIDTTPGFHPVDIVTNQFAFPHTAAAYVG